jgi:hypothetical protein
VGATRIQSRQPSDNAWRAWLYNVPDPQPMRLRAGPRPVGALARCRPVEEGAVEQGAGLIEAVPSEAGREAGSGPMEGAEAGIKPAFMKKVIN